ncbi:MAG: DMT family transporter [Firmicutes bacterium]|nr:DMT family transporter [Bacillota bacterium]
MAESKKGALLLAIAAAGGGIGFVWVKILLDAGATSLQVLAGRYLVSCVFMLMVLLAKPKKMEKETIKKGAVLGAVLFVSFILMLEGLKKTTPSISAFLTNSQSVMVPVIMFVVFRKKPSIYVLLGAVMTIIGAWMLSFTGEAEMSMGAVLCLGAAVMFALQIVLLGDYVTGCDPTHLAAVEGFVVLVMAAAFSVLKGEKLPAFGFDEISSLVMLGFFSTFAYFLLQSIGQKHTSQFIAGIIITSESVFAAIFSWMLYGERMSPMAIGGCIMIFSAILIVEGGAKIISNLTSSEK